MAGRGNKKRFSKATNRKPRRSEARSLFVVGGVLSSWQPETQSPKGRYSRNGDGNSMFALRSGNSRRKRASGSKYEYHKPRVNALGYLSPGCDFQEGSLANGIKGGDNHLVESHPFVLVDSEKTKIFAYIDQTPSTELKNREVSYNYSTTSALDETPHRGLGFNDEAEATPSGIGSSLKVEEKEGSFFDSLSSHEGMDADVSYTRSRRSRTKVGNLLTETSPSKDNSGFLSIGGMKLYTQDVSDEEDDEESLESYWAGDSPGSSDSDDSEYTYGSDSDIDEDIAEDYFQGIGGTDNIIDVNRLVGQVLDVSDDDNDGTVEKFGGTALRDRTKEYRMKKARSATYSWLSALDDRMLVTDPRSIFARKKRVARFRQSWPPEAQKSKYLRKIPGEKKKHRKEMTASKRRERMIRRGIDLEKINNKLQQMVLDEVDILSFQPMHSHECSQVQRLAEIYHLQSACERSGKKRFVTVTRTQHTCMPSSNDKLRLKKLIVAGKEDVNFTINGIKSGKGDRYTGKNAAKRRRLNPHGLEQCTNADSSGKASKKKRREKTGSYAAQPMSFISTGTMQSDTVEIRTVDSQETNDGSQENKGVAGSLKYGAFESHTTGFGSKMMAKMGFIEGGGLGKDGQGMAEPIEAIQRPRSLGLGAKASEKGSNLGKSESKKFASSKKHTKSLGLGAKASKTGSDSGKNESKKFGAFERHTTGFGSKIMEKMGFVEGMGLGKDSQGIINPLAAIRLPKSRGLGAKK